MPGPLYAKTLQELQEQHPDAEISPVVYQVGHEFFAAQKEIEDEGELKGFTSVLLIAKSGQIVLAKKSYGPEGWCLPGGGVEADESFHDCAEREILEEVGVRPEELTLLLIEEETFVSPEGEKAHSLLGVFVATMNKFALPPTTAEAQEEGIELALFDPDKLPEKMLLSDRDKIEAYFSDEND